MLHIDVGHVAVVDQLAAVVRQLNHQFVKLRDGQSLALHQRQHSVYGALNR